MSMCSKERIFSIFSANHWNHPEPILFFPFLINMSTLTVSKKRTLSDLIEYYIKVHLSKFPSRLKDQTYHLNWWNEQYGRKKLTEITPALLTGAKEILLDGVTHRKINRSEATVNRYFSTLSKAFSLASREWQWISENPFRRISKLKEGPGRNRFLSKDELQILLEKCKESKNSHLYGMVLIAASMGLRMFICLC
jgi:integrase